MIASTLQRYFERTHDPRVIAAYLFGSHAAGRTHRESDVDVAVLLDRAEVPERAARDEAQLRIAADVIAELHRNEVDVVILNDAPPLFARHIVHTGIVVFVVDRRVLHAFERDAQLRAADVEPFVQRGRRRILEVLRG